MHASSPVKAGLIAAIVGCLPAIAYVLTYSSAHAGKTLLVGVALAVCVGLVFALYWRFAALVMERGMRAQRMRVAAASEEPVFSDPLEEEDAALEARFAALERRD
jgi:hypothetical protein